MNSLQIAHRISRSLASALFFTLIPAAFGQLDTSAVLGSVTDARGGTIANSRVTLTNTGTGITRNSTTNDSGSFQFLEVHLGQYTVQAEAPGFKKSETPEFRVAVGERRRVSMTLEVGEVTQTVEVRSAASAVEADSSDRGQVITNEEVTNLPLNGRSTASLALLAPGVRQAFGLAKREASFNVSGLRSQFNNFSLDGVDNNAYGTSNQDLSNQVIQVAPDALQEFKVVTNSYNPEYGRVGGAVVTATVKAGTNQVHGAVWEYLRNTDLNATGFFKPAAGSKPVYIQNQFGGAAGGPIRKNKMFIFADYEGLRRLQRSLSTSTVPTLALI